MGLVEILQSLDILGIGTVAVLLVAILILVLLFGGKKYLNLDKKIRNWVIGGIAVIIGVSLLGVFSFGDLGGDVQAAAIADATAEAELIALGCPDSGFTDFAPEMHNPLNTSGETYDATYYLTGESSGTVRGTDTTNPTVTDIACGEKFTYCPIAAKGAQGDHSLITGIRGADLGATVITSGDNVGCVEFVSKGAIMNFDFEASQHGVLQARAYDLQAAGWVFDSGGLPAANFATMDAIEFDSTVNQTALAVGTGGVVDYRFDLKTSETDQTYNDHYFLVMIELGTASHWKDPLVEWEGVQVSEATDLTAEEIEATAEYEHVYKISGEDIGSVESALRVRLDAESDQNPTANVEVDLVAAGRYLSSDGVTTRVGAYKDDSANTAVYDVQDMNLDLS